MKKFQKKGFKAAKAEGKTPKLITGLILSRSSMKKASYVAGHNGKGRGEVHRRKMSQE